MKLIERWALMRNVRTENVQEHSLQVAIVAHALAVVKNKFYEGTINVERVALLAVFHDASEVLTGDMPTPVKYFNPEIKEAYKAIEDEATTRLLSFLPNELMADYQPLLSVTEEDKEEWALVKAADTICAYIKCLEEAATGNREFNQAKLSIKQKINSMDDRPEVQYFMRHFVESFSLNLDEMHS